MATSASEPAFAGPQDSLYDRIKDKPLHVDLVILHKGRTRPYIIEKELLRIQGAKSLDDLKERLLEAQESLEALNIFQAVQLILNESPTVSIWSVLQEGLPGKILIYVSDMSITCRVTLKRAH